MATATGTATITKGKDAKSAKPAKAAKPEKAPKSQDPLADKQGRLPHPALEVDAEGNPTKLLKGVPADYDGKKHQPLKAKNFEDESQWYLFKAAKAEADAAMFRKKAEEAKAIGGKGGAKIKKFFAMKDRFEKMMAELKGEGLDLDEMFAKIQPKSEEDSEESAE